MGEPSKHNVLHVIVELMITKEKRKACSKWAVRKAPGIFWVPAVTGQDWD